MTSSIIHSGLVAGLAERLDDLEALGDLLALGLAGGLAHLAARSSSESSWTSMLLEHLADGLAAHAGGERVVAVLLEELLVASPRRGARPARAAVSFGSMTM